MALPTSSISQQAIKNALGTSESGVIALCQSSKTNKWSGTKPFRSSTTRFTYAELVAALKAANFGLDIQGDSSAADALNRAAGNTEIWPHLKPQNTASSPCRQGDFRGYNHNAPIPYSSGLLTQKGLSGYYNPNFEISLIEAAAAEVKVSEMTIKTGKWMVLWRLVGSSSINEIQGDNISQSPNYVVGSASPNAAGTYEACIAVLRPGAGEYYAIPNTYKRFTLEITNDIAAYLKLTVTVECWQKETRTGNGKWQVFTRITVKNNDSVAIQSAFRFVLQEPNVGNSVFTGDIANLAAGATTVFYPGDDTTTADFGYGNMTWGVTDPYEAGNDEPQYSFSGWVNKNNGGIHVVISGQPEMNVSV